MYYIIEMFALSGNEYVRYKSPSQEAAEEWLEIYRSRREEGSTFWLCSEAEMGRVYELDEKL